MGGDKSEAEKRKPRPCYIRINQYLAQPRQDLLSAPAAQELRESIANGLTRVKTVRGELLPGSLRVLRAEPSNQALTGNAYRRLTRVL